MPSHKYVPGHEIRQHCVRLAKHWDLYQNAIWGTLVKELRWIEEEQMWQLVTDKGDDIKARFVVAAGGPINCPHLPDVPGIDSFKGHEWHTARWDYNYTGGHPDGDFKFDKLKDKRVAIVGTGATAIQAIPHLAEWSKELYVFQRTPSAVDVRDNKPTDPEWWKSLPKGWQEARDDAFQIGAMGQDTSIAIDDGFSLSNLSYWSLVRRQAKTGEGKEYGLMELLQLADFRHMERIRKRIDDIVTNKEAAEILKPWFNLWCKRPVYSGGHRMGCLRGVRDDAAGLGRVLIGFLADTYLPAFNKPSVHLIDTAPFKGIERVTEKGIVVGGKEYEVDAIVWSTGFETPGWVNATQAKAKMLLTFFTM